MQELKFALLGLDNAGKSTLLYALKHLYGYEETVKAFKPTVQIRYEQQNFLTLSINFWDFGGQSAFRELYLQHPEYFDNIDTFLYMIDIQDDTRFTLSTDYLGYILDILTMSDYDKSRPLNICFSKSDCEVIKACYYDYDARNQMLKDLIINRFPDFKFKFHSTSIFDIYSIVRMISTIIHPFLSFGEELDGKFTEFADANQIENGLLFNSSGVILTLYSRTNEDSFGYAAKVSEILDAHLRIFRQIDEKKLDIITTKDHQDESLIFCHQLNLYDFDLLDAEERGIIMEGKAHRTPYLDSYYLSLIANSQQEEVIESSIDNLVEQIRSILSETFKEQESED